jgi:hypothetical protein
MKLLPIPFPFISSNHGTTRECKRGNTTGPSLKLPHPRPFIRFLFSALDWPAKRIALQGIKKGEKQSRLWRGARLDRLIEANETQNTSTRVDSRPNVLGNAPCCHQEPGLASCHAEPGQPYHVPAHQHTSIIQWSSIPAGLFNMSSPNASFVAKPENSPVCPEPCSLVPTPHQWASIPLPRRCMCSTELLYS